ncbi:MAG: hypothetical protein ACPG4K_13805 [Haloferula sp.]
MPLDRSLVALCFVVIVIVVLVRMIFLTAFGVVMRVPVIMVVITMIVAVLMIMAVPAFSVPIFTMFRMIAVTLVEYLGVFKRVAFAGDTCKEGSSGKKVKRLHRDSF